MTSDIRVNAQRLWDSLETMAQIGATEKGGVCRLALTDLDKEGRDLMSQWCEAEGLERSIDVMGNMFFHRKGRSPDIQAVGIGSHLDTQPTGGKYDGVYGVLSALEVVRTLNDHNIDTEIPVEIVVWTNEEGARFAPAMLGSGVFAEVFDVEYGHSRSDLEGKTVGDELSRIGYLGDLQPGDHGFSAFFEAHIEQGPILENEDKLIGVVTSVQGVNWYDVCVRGEETHAGPMPMTMRKDAMECASRMLPEVFAIAARYAPHARATVGQFGVVPGSRNTVPSRVEFSVDLRHPSRPIFDQMDHDLKALVERFDHESKVNVGVDHFWSSPPVEFDANCIQSVTNSAKICGYDYIDIVSGAGHDSVYISKIAPVSMIFIPCDDGVSHAEIENTSIEAAEAGANVLLHTVLQNSFD